MKFHFIRDVIHGDAESRAHWFTYAIGSVFGFKGLDKAGKGTTVTKNKERVDFGKPIGKYYDIVTGQYIETNRGMIHYGKDGAHIVPAKPSE